MLFRATFFVFSLLLSLDAYASDIEDIQLLLKNKHFNQALEKADKAIAAAPQNPQAQFLKGLAQVELKQTAEAIKTFTALAASHPQLPEPYNNLAVLYAQQNELDKSRAALTMAIQTNPSYAIAHENLGDLYARMASQAYDKALQLEQTNTTLQTKLTLVKELFTASPITRNKSAGSVKITTPTIPATASVSTLPVTVGQTSVSAAIASKTGSVNVVERKKPAASVPAATPAPVPGPNSRDDALYGDISKAVESWAHAWSKQNVDGYLSAYAKDFKTTGKQSFNEWAKERRKRITAPKDIQVSLSNIQISMVDELRAKVKFRQTYRSNVFSSTTGKTLILRKQGNRWLIVEENT